jgi:hypothetical protein
MVLGRDTRSDHKQGSEYRHDRGEHGEIVSLRAAHDVARTLISAEVSLLV